jgi:hypothetical protein
VYDGVCYTIEFKVADQYRRYTYCNPVQYAEFYPHSHELNDFVGIVKVFEECAKE